MHIVAQCPHCSLTYKLAPEAAGRQAKCKCGSMFIIQPVSTPEPQPSAVETIRVPNASSRAAAAAAAKSAPFVPPPVVIETDDEEEISPKSRWLLLGGIGSAIVILLIVGTMFWRGKSHATTVDQPVAQLTPAFRTPLGLLVNANFATTVNNILSSSRNKHMKDGTRFLVLTFRTDGLVVGPYSTADYTIRDDGGNDFAPEGISTDGGDSFIPLKSCDEIRSSDSRFNLAIYFEVLQSSHNLLLRCKGQDISLAPLLKESLSSSRNP